jgi:hypothetical protein
MFDGDATASFCPALFAATVAIDWTAGEGRNGGMDVIFDIGSVGASLERSDLLRLSIKRRGQKSGRELMY